MERLQGLQSTAAIWATQTRKKGWRLKGGNTETGIRKRPTCAFWWQWKYWWTKSTINCRGHWRTKRGGMILQQTMNKWPWAADNTKELELIWVMKMQETLRNQDFTKKGVQKNMKKWVWDQVPIRGCRIMWRKILREKDHFWTIYKCKLANWLMTKKVFLKLKKIGSSQKCQVWLRKGPKSHCKTNLILIC